MNFKRNVIVVVAAILTFGGMFVTVRSCNAADPAQTPQTPATKVEQTIDLGLLAKAKKDLSEQQKILAASETFSDKIVATKKVQNLQEVIALLQAEGETKPAEPAAVSYVNVANEVSDLVPVYSGNEVYEPAGFGSTLADGLTLADKEKAAEIRTVKTAFVNRLQEAHTRAVLDQSELHLPEYTALLNAAPRNEVVLEAIQQERLRDEASIEKLANPSFWQCLKWWWNS